MTDISNPTEELDKAKRKPETTRQIYFENLKKFISSTIGSGIKVLIWFILSLIVIYICKLAQSNILPTDINCYPYTNNKDSEPEKIETFIFTNLFFRKPRKAMILEFPDTDNSFIDGFIRWLGKYPQNPKSSFYGNFLVAIFKPLFANTFSYYNTMFSFLNQIPEFLLVIFGPILGAFIFMVGSFYSVLCICYYWIGNLEWMWKKNANIIVDKNGKITNKGPPNWQDVRWKSPDPEDPSKSEWFACFIGFCLIGLLVFTLITLLTSQLLLLFSFVFSFICIITCLTYRVKLSDKPSSVSDMFTYFFKYNKLVIMTIFSLYVVSNAYTYLGSTSAGFSVLTLILIYYFNIIEMFVPIKTDEDERIEVDVNSSQAKRTPCEPPEESAGAILEEGEKVASFSDRSRFGVSSNNEIKKDWGIKSTLSKDRGVKTGIINLFGKKKEGGEAEGSGIVPVPEEGAQVPGAQVQEPAQVPGAQVPGAQVQEPAQEPVQVPEGAPVNVPQQGMLGRLFGNKKTQPPPPQVSGEVAPVTEPKKSSFMSNMKIPRFPFSTNSAKIAPEVTKGGKRRKPLELDSNNLVRELKKFNKKYAQLLQ